MRLALIPALMVMILAHVNAQNDAESEIRQLLEDQRSAWNEGDLEGFMDGYVKGDDLLFVGKSGYTKGWEPTLLRYKERYTSIEAMGTLEFKLHQINKRTDDVYTVVGQYFLTRKELDDLDGYFLLVVLRTEEGWKVAADSTH